MWSFNDWDTRAIPPFTDSMNTEALDSGTIMAKQQKFLKNDHKCNMPDYPRILSAEFKYEVLHRCFVLGEDVKYVSREIVYSRMGMYDCEEKI